MQLGPAEAWFFDPDPRAELVRRGLMPPMEIAELGAPEELDRLAGAAGAGAGWLGFGQLNMTAAALVAAVGGDGSGSRRLYYYSDPLPAAVSESLFGGGGAEPLLGWGRGLFLTEHDAARQVQQLWLSSAGVQMHTHMDSDHNFFTMLAGSKRFTLHDPADTGLLRPFPRLHPLWHKAQCHPTRPAGGSGDQGRFRMQSEVIRAVSAEDGPMLAVCPAAGRCPPAELGLLAPMEATLTAGDVLYIPPYTWHSVQSLTAAVAVSSWSDNANVRRCPIQSFVAWAFSSGSKANIQWCHPRLRL